MIVTSGNAIRATVSAKHNIPALSNGLKPAHLMHVPRMPVNENRKTAEIAPRLMASLIEISRSGQKSYGLSRKNKFLKDNPLSRSLLLILLKSFNAALTMK